MIIAQQVQGGMNNQQTKDIIQIDLALFGIRGCVRVGDDDITKIAPPARQTRRQRRRWKRQDIGRRIQLTVFKVQFSHWVVRGNDNRQAAAGRLAALLKYGRRRLFQARNIKRILPPGLQINAVAHDAVSGASGLTAVCGSCAVFDPLRLGRGGTSSKGSSSSIMPVFIL